MTVNHLINSGEWAGLTRPSSVHLDSDEIELFIEECEDMYIVPAIGAEVYLKLLDTEKLTDEWMKLLDGGRYTGKDGKIRIVVGLKKALAYFVYAKMSKNDGAIVGRSGFIQHQDEYAQRLDDKNRVNKYNDTMNVAEKYLGDAMEYLKFLSGDDNMKGIRGSRVRVYDVGD